MSRTDASSVPEPGGRHRVAQGVSPGWPATRLFPGRILLLVIFATILAQIITMAWISQYNVHPDERSHVTVADYYLHWWAPPAAGDPRIIPSVSAYGFSYHYNPTLTYFLAGRTMAPVKDLIQNPFRAFRLWNVGLFAMLIAVALWRKDPLFALLLLLCPAQLWYVFAYFNDDAMALAVSLLCCWLLVHPDAPFARFLAADDWRTSRLGALVFALLLALLVLSKQNYRVFLAFLGVYAVWTITVSSRRDRARRLTLKWCAVGLAALCLAAPRFAIDAWINDPEAVGNRGLTKWERIGEVTEAYGTRDFRIPEPGSGAAYPGLNMKSHGVRFIDLFLHYRWHEITYQSLVGVYGYVNLYSGTAFYLATLIAYLSLVVTISILVAKHGGLPDRILGLMCLLTWGGLVLASARNSWLVDFEPQGRYLFPGIGILFITIMQFRSFIPTRVLWRYGLMIWLLSSYSFILTGLRWIPKFSV